MHGIPIPKATDLEYYDYDLNKWIHIDGCHPLDAAKNLDKLNAGTHWSQKDSGKRRSKKFKKS